MAINQPFVADILNAIPPTSASAWAQRSLRVFARMADENESLKTYFTEFDEESSAGADLLLAACIMTTIKKHVGIGDKREESEVPCLHSYRFEDNKLILEFSSACPRPPIHAIWANLDKLKLELMKCYQRIPEGAYAGEYAVMHTIDTPLDVIGFTHSFTQEDDLPGAFYDLPKGVSFTDSEGETYEGQAPREVMEEYLKAHPHPELPNNSVDDLEPAALIISPAQMQRIIDALDLGIEKDRRPS